MREREIQRGGTLQHRGNQSFIHKDDDDNRYKVEPQGLSGKGDMELNIVKMFKVKIKILLRTLRLNIMTPVVLDIIVMIRIMMLIIQT